MQLRASRLLLAGAYLVACTVFPAASQSVNIDCGAYQSYRAADGAVWSADQYYSGGQQLYTSYNVSGTSDSPLYRTSRVGYYGDFSYAIPVSNGSYSLTLKFADVQFSAPGQRIFNVVVNGTTVLSRFDVAAAGGFYNAIDRQFPVVVTDGTLRIQVQGVVKVGLLSAIQLSATGAAPVAVSLSPTEGTLAAGTQMTFTATVSGAANPAVTWAATAGTIAAGVFTAPAVTVATPVTITATSVEDPSKSASVQVTVTPPAPPPPDDSGSDGGTGGGPSGTQTIRIDCGASQGYTAADGTVWSADQYYTGGQQVYTGYLPGIYGTARGGYYGDFSYAIPVTNGLYTVTLKFAEIQFSGLHQRVFNVLLNGTRVISNLDLVAQGAYYKTLDMPFPVAVTDGMIRISTQAVTGTALLNAIQIVPAPALRLSAGTLSFAGFAGGANPSAQTIDVTNASAGPLTWTASNTQSWLHLSAASGSAPTPLSISVTTAGLAAGTYSDTITVAAPDATNSPQTISVTLTLTGAPPVLSLSTHTAAFSATSGGANPPAQSVSITNAGGGSLSWTASKTQSWLTLTATSGVAPANLSLGALVNGLAAGVYSDTVTISAGTADTQSVAVTLTVTAPTQTQTGILVANWTFDTNMVVNNTALDSSESNLYGVLNGNSTLTAGKLGQALVFDGTTTSVFVAPDSRLALAQDLTLAAWIKTQNSTRTETVISKYNASGSEDGYIVETTPDGYLQLRLGGQNVAGNRDILDGTNKINDGQWHHIAVIIRPAQDVMFYIDGGLSSVDYLTITGGATGTGFGIGGPTFISNYFTGSIDDVRVYTRALTSAEIAQLFGSSVITVAGGEHLYNGIVMPKNFPPPTLPTQVARTPYYLNNPPLVIPINVGRQFFVDDFLIEHSTLQRTPHRPVIQPLPVLTPGSPISAGAWYDPASQLYKLWYYNETPDYRYAYSSDGLNWTLPSIPDALVPGTNEVVRGGDTIWLDLQETNPERRYKSFAVDVGAGKIYVYFSADGIHWSAKQDFGMTTLSDRTTVFWNPFRQVWVNSDRGSAGSIGRARFYSESKDLTTWTPADPSKTFWTGPDDQDPPYYGPGGEPPELYNLDSVGYESVMVGLFSWFYPGVGYKDYQLPGPILVELGVGFSRDGFSWDRPTRGGASNAFIPASNQAGTWNAFNTQSVGGGFLVVGDELWFYFSARTLQKPLDGVFSTGLAKLRRDGFYSMDAGATEGTLQTRTVTFTGNHFFVNADTSNGQLLVEALDENGNVLPGFSKANCTPLHVNKTLQEVTWPGANLGTLSGKKVKFKFYLTNGSLYSFWVTPSAQGASYGYVAAGGPGFTSVIDTVGAAH